MTTPPKNTGCGSSNVFGGFEQTLFLGCSVMSFSASAGWNEQQSEVTVQLVKDPCAANKTYFTTALTSSTWSAADPGFVGLSTDIIGAPVYFRVGNFEFSGLVQSWDETGSVSGNPTYQVKIVDPRAVLENCQVIINEYAGGVGSIYNLVNVFGYMETFGAACPEYYQSSPGVYSAGSGSVDGTVFGSVADAYGGADVNENGMQWNQILAGLRLLLSGATAITNVWSPYGRLALKAPSSIGNGMGMMAADSGSTAFYYIDLQEVPTAPSYWRLNGANTSLMEAISNICGDAGHDYYIELIPVSSSGIHKIIKVRTVDRASTPVSGAIDSFIGASGREVINYSKGKEFRNEPTSAFVIGGPKQSFYQAEQSDDPEGDGDPAVEEADDMIIPFFGLDPDTGDVLVPELDADGFWEIDLPSQDLAFQLASPKYNRAIQLNLLIGEQEMMAADSGFDTWMSYASTNDTELWQALAVNIAGIWDVQHIINVVKNLAGNINGNKLRPEDFAAIRKNVFPPHNQTTKDFEVVQIGYAWLKKIVDNYYGKKYQVRVPFTCGRTDTESDQILTSEEPSDGGWTEVTPVLELAHPSIASDFFTLDDNRLGAFCRFDAIDGLEVSNLDINEFIALDTNADGDPDKVWIKVGVEDGYVYLDKSTLFSPRAVITLPQPIKLIEEQPDLQQQWAGLVELMASSDPNADREDLEARLEQVQKELGAILTHVAFKTKAEMPDAAGFGIKSNILTYGPWGSAGPAGGVVVTHDEGLVPWEYGGFTTLNLAGNSIATEGVTNQQVLEKGSVTEAGYPAMPLGAELLSADSGGPFNGGGTNLIENRSLSTASSNGINYAYTGIGGWDGSYGPNVTDITTQVGPNGAQTTYNVRIWSPKFGRFAKGNAERLKKVGQQRLKYNKQLRAFTLHRVRRSQAAVLDNLAGNKKGVFLEDGIFGKPKTPHSLMAGQLLNWNDSAYRRPLAHTASALELPVDMADQYGEKAFMSLDGLIRPVSMDGDGGLPRYVTPKDHCQKTHNMGMQPPTDKPGEAGSFNQYNLTIDIDSLNPITNPTGFNRRYVAEELTDTPGVGHDIEIIARGTGVPASSMVMPIQGYADSEDTSVSDYDDDYRFLALRGPLLLQSWGYDLDGFPVPNKVDSESAASGGVYEEENLQHKFLDSFLRKSHTWPVAPIDLRLDRKRGVWTVPHFRNVIGYLREDVAAFESGVAVQTSGPTLYDSDGYSISTPEFLAYDAVGCAPRSGDTIIAEYDPYDCKYYILESCARFSVSDDNCCLSPESGYVRPALGEVLNYSHINFGAGLWLHEAGESDETCSVTGVGANSLLHVFAGFRPINNHTGCFNEDDELTSDGSRFINVVDFQGGLRAVNGDNSCDLLLRAGIEAYSQTGSINIEDPLPQEGYINHKIVFRRGIEVRDPDYNDCEIEIGAGFTVGSTGCGLIQDGMVDGNALFSRMIFDDTLAIQQIDDYTLGIGSNFKINGNSVKDLSLGDCLELQAGEECAYTIAISGGSGGQVEFVTDVYCSGSNMVVETAYLNFTSCGLFEGTSTGVE